MLIYQGAEAFRLWTGEEMPVEMVRRALTAVLKAEGS
jgi:shikimate dehydrogenase